MPHLTTARGSAEVKLPKATASTHADQVRELGLKVGDTIVGRESTHDWWQENRLTLLWLGEKVAVWQTERRDIDAPLEFKPTGESANWTLTCRDWRIIINPQ